MDTDDRLIHVHLPCPSCEEPVEVVFETWRREARWSCLRCQVIGFAPALTEMPGVVPTAVAQA